MSGTPYIASGDSALLRKALRAYSGGSFLEIGAGNGGNLVTLSGRFELVFGTDLVRPGMSDWKEHRANFALTDAAGCVRDSSFDLVAFNPPYVSGAIHDRAVDGGEGLEVPREFLEEAMRVVKEDGRVLFLLSQEADLRAFEHICKRRGFVVRRVASERGFFEELSVYEAERG